MDPSLAGVRGVLGRTPVGSARAAFSVLTDLVGALPAGDGIWCFSRLYQAVTDQVRSSIADATFHDPAFLDRLDAAFANLYFSALASYVDDKPDTPRAWYPLFAARSEPKAALQFALAGMNAHINRDLPVALVQACERSGIELARDTPQHADYLAVNPLLATVEARVKTEFLSGQFAVADHLLGRLDDVVANFSVVEARNAAWSHGETFWAIRNNPALTATFLDSLDGLVGLASRGLLVSL
jgi:Family of unknown function (DUF5995)